MATTPTTPREPDADGIAAAREYCGWHLGSRVWADYIIAAYLNPEQARAALAAEKAE